MAGQREPILDDPEMREARRFIHDAVEHANERWIPVAVIGTAMIEELVALSTRSGDSRALALYLRRLAQLIEADGGNVPSQNQH